MKAFVTYTVLRVGLLVVCYVVLGGLYLLVFGETDVLIWPIIAAVVVSSALSFKLLARPRERFAQSVEARAERASANFERRRAKEDFD